MSDPAASQKTDPMAQLMLENLPETVEDMREMLDGFAAMLNGDLPEVGKTHDGVAISGAGSGVTADIVAPQGAGPWPVLVYLHGGGWICGSPESHRKLGYRFAEAGYLVFNIDYRLAPEHPFPAPFDDCVAAIRWAAREAARYGGDPSRLAVGGDSAGGNLAAAAAIALADDPEVRIGAALLIYGVFDFEQVGALDPEMVEANPGMAEAGENLVELMVGSYLGPDRSEALMADPRVSPIHAADRLPPSYVLCGGADGLAAQAEVLAEVLLKARIPHEKRIVENMPHGFAQMEFFPQARESIDQMVAFLGRHLK